MIGTLLRVGVLNLKRDYVALGLTFVLPIVFFSIFAVIFGGMGGAKGGNGKAINVAVVDLDGTEVSARFTAAIGKEAALSVVPGASSQDDARALVRGGEVPVAVIVLAGFGDSPEVEILYDESDPVAHQMVGGLLQKVAMTAAPDLMMKRGLEMLEQYGGPLTERQRAVAKMGERMLAEGGGGGGPEFSSPVKIRAVNVRQKGGEVGAGGSIVSYYAAGIGVMFLLFSMAGAAGSLLEEEENGTLERVLSTRVGMGMLLSSRWLFFTLVGILQVTLMFVWGALAFGLDLFTANHLAGFAAMGSLTAAAAAAFGIMLATLCRTRAQLGGISTVVILIMSALGGSMVPRFVMPDFMNVTALFTFNGWALDGFLKVFWFDQPGEGMFASLLRLLPELGVLAGMTAAFLGLARLFARRWEAV